MLACLSMTHSSAYVFVCCLHWNSMSCNSDQWVSVGGGGSYKRSVLVVMWCWGGWDWASMLMRSLTWDKTRTTATHFSSFSFLPLPFILSPPLLLLLLSPFLHCSLLPVSHSCPQSLDNRSQFIKGKPGHHLFSITYLLPVPSLKQCYMLPQVYISTIWNQNE